MSGMGKRLVRALLEEKTWEPCIAAGVDRTKLLDDAQVAWDWVREFHRTHGGEWPTVAMLEENTGVFLPEELDPLEYVADLVRKRHLGNELNEVGKSVGKLLDDRDPDEALRMIAAEAVRLREHSTVSAVTSLRRTGPAVADEYALVKASGGLLGIPTRWRRLDREILGWVDGTLNVVTAMQNTGKTWFACLIAEDALERGKRVLFVTLEMALDRIRRRMISIRHRIPWRRLLFCELDDAEEEMLRAELDEEVAGEGDILLADKQMVRTVADVSALVADYLPDLVVVDGGYRFQPTKDDKNSSLWANTVEVVNDLQLAAEMTRVPWVVTTQQGDANESGKPKKKKAGGKSMFAWGVRYGKEWVINPDTVIGLYQDQDLRMGNLMEVHLLKQRDGAGTGDRGFFHITWDFKAMQFMETTPETAGTAEDVGEGEEGMVWED